MRFSQNTLGGLHPSGAIRAISSATVRCTTTHLSVRASSFTCFPRRHFSSSISIPQSASIQASVPHRAVLSFQGRDTYKLLQGLVTNNVLRLAASQAGQGVQYCAFLNPQGRIIAPAFLYNLGAEQVLVDVDSRTLESMQAFVKRFKLRSKVQLQDKSDTLSVLAAWGSRPSLPAPASDRGTVIASGVDERTPHMGLRAIVDRPYSEQQDQNSASYTVHRTLQGVPETSEEIWVNQSLPLEANVDLMNGVDYRKGCYVGQELTARTHHTGVVRKRIVPVVLSAEDVSSVPPELEHNPEFRPAFVPQSGVEVRSVPIGEGRDRSAGKFLSCVDNLGLALLRLDQVHRWGTDFHMRVASGHDDNKHLWLRPFLPTWWPTDVRAQ